MSTKTTYIDKMKAQLDALDAQMNLLESKATGAKKEAQEKYKEEMGKLRHQSKLAILKLEEMQAAGEDTWENMVDEMEKVRNAFTSSFHYFKSQI
jgi:ribosome recycling factor